MGFRSKVRNKEIIKEEESMQVPNSVLKELEPGVQEIVSSLINGSPWEKTDLTYPIPKVTKSFTPDYLQIRYLGPDDRLIIVGNSGTKYVFTTAHREGPVLISDTSAFLGLVKRIKICCGGGEEVYNLFELVGPYIGGFVPLED